MKRRDSVPERYLRCDDGVQKVIDTKTDLKASFNVSNNSESNLPLLALLLHHHLHLKWLFLLSIIAMNTSLLSHCPNHEGLQGNPGHPSVTVSMLELQPMKSKTSSLRNLRPIDKQ